MHELNVCSLPSDERNEATHCVRARVERTWLCKPYTAQLNSAHRQHLKYHCSAVLENTLIKDCQPQTSQRRSWQNSILRPTEISTGNQYIRNQEVFLHTIMWLTPDLPVECELRIKLVSRNRHHRMAAPPGADHGR